MMGGELSVESALGAGSTFRVRLPLEQLLGRPGPRRRPGSPASAPWSSRRRAAAARITAAMLADWGAEVVTAADRRRALDARRWRRPAGSPSSTRACSRDPPADVSADALAVALAGLVSVVLVHVRSSARGARRAARRAARR